MEFVIYKSVASEEAVVKLKLLWTYIYQRHVESSWNIIDPAHVPRERPLVCFYRPCIITKSLTFVPEWKTIIEFIFLRNTREVYPKCDIILY